MKITLIIGSLYGGGAERVLCNLANELVVRGHIITVLTVSDKQSYYLDSRIKHISLSKELYRDKFPHIFINIVRLLKMVLYFLFTKMDLCITFLDVSKYVFKCKFAIRCPIIFSERADPEKFVNESIQNKKIFEERCKKSDYFVFQTNEAMDYYVQHGISKDCCIVIPNAAPVLNKENLKINKDKVIVGVGRLDEQKNFQMLIRAYKRISSDIPEYKLFIYGEGTLRSELIQLIKDLKLTDKVFLPGYVRDIENKIARASIFVLSSNYEGMPNALMEAMALGVPVISTDCPVGGPRLLIQENVSGILIPVGDEQALAIALKDMAKNYQHASEIGKLGQKSIIQKFSPDVIFNKWEEFIKKCGMSKYY